MNNNEKQLNIDIKEDVADGIYANVAVIAHSDSEFVLDFIRMMPGIPKGQVKARIIMTPENTRRLLVALQDNLSKYDSKHGGTSNEKGNPMPIIGFSGGNA